jgi:hypothetical protein
MKRAVRNRCGVSCSLQRTQRSAKAWRSFEPLRLFAEESGGAQLSLGS